MRMREHVDNAGIGIVIACVVVLVIAGALLESLHAPLFAYACGIVTALLFVWWVLG